MINVVREAVTAPSPLPQLWQGGILDKKQHWAVTFFVDVSEEIVSVDNDFLLCLF